jgi:phenylacetate-CoA ligase
MQPEADYLSRAELAKIQGDRLSALLDALLPANPFYARKFALAGLSRRDIQNPDDLIRLPFTTKAELTTDQEANPPYGSLLTYPRDRFCRLHQTSGTKGSPLRWLDTPQSWNWMLDNWAQLFRIAGVTAHDRLFFAFSFGPFLGFWTAFEAAARLGCLCLAGGGLSSLARLRMLLDNQATVLLCTPTYALHLAQVAQENHSGARGCALQKIIVAGEPGGSIPATRKRMEQAWNARVFDHSGMTEIGPVAIECPENPAGLHILEADYLAEVIDPASGAAVPPGHIGELMLTNLGRHGSPLLRYRTGDLVRVDPKPCPCGRTFLRLDGGILGRTDDMIPVRGDKVYPAALEDVIRRFAEVAEYRVEVDTGAPLAELRIEVEPVAACELAPKTLADRIAAAIRDELFFRAEVIAVPPGSLPRFEMKAQRIKRRPPFSPGA